jgi:hypothetical protein
MEEVGARVSLKNARKAQKDAQGVARAVDDIGDEAKQAGRKLGQMNAASRALGSGVRSLGVGMGLAASAAAGMTFIIGKKSVTAASDLGEQINKTSVVFRGSEQSIMQWSKQTGDALGISRREALESAGTFGNMLVPMGVARKKAGDMSRGLVDLSADMASFNNADPSEVLEALRSGLSGETEPLRKFGVFLSAARVEQEAANLGLQKGKKKLTEAAKAQAVYSLILKDTGDAQGDFANTASSLPNLQRRIAANTENLSAAFGQGLEPGVARAADALNGFITDVTPAAENIGAAASEILFTSNDLSAGEKVSRLFNISKAELGPALDPIIASIEAELGKIDTGKAIGDAIRSGAPVAADALAAQVPNMARAFVEAFRNAGTGGQLLTVGLLAAKFGAFSSIGGWAAGRMTSAIRGSALWASAGAAAGAKFGAAQAAASAAAMQAGMIASATHGRLAAAGSTAGRLLGTKLGMAAGAAAVTALSAYIVDHMNSEGDKPGNRTDSNRNLIENSGQPGGGDIVNALKGLIPGLATGGTVNRGGMAMVGERGPELLTLPRAAKVTPLDSGFQLPAAGGDGGRITFEGPLVIKMGDEIVHRQNVKIHARRAARK